jgi:hypothetical protein
MNVDVSENGVAILYDLYARKIMIYNRMWGFQVLRQGQKTVSNYVMLNPKTIHIRNLCGMEKNGRSGPRLDQMSYGCPQP